MAPWRNELSMAAGEVPRPLRELGLSAVSPEEGLRLIGADASGARG